MSEMPVRRRIVRRLCCAKAAAATRTRKPKVLFCGLLTLGFGSVHLGLIVLGLGL